MTNILILTHPDDAHAICVKLALEAKGHDGVLCYSGDFPELQTQSIYYGDSAMSWGATGIDGNPDRLKIDVVWNRRFGKPLMPDSLHKDDIGNANRESHSFYRGLWQTVLQDAVWVNPMHNQKRANHKSYQLKIAEEVGLKIPKTLISNNPENIRNFLLQNNNTNVIYKTLTPMSWFTNEYTAMVYTREITEDMLPSDSVLQSVPGIFQEKISKAYELRVTYFGDSYIAVKINSQAHPEAVNDWRTVSADELGLTQEYLPVEIDRKCQLLMWRMGLIFGCFDFIVTPEHEYYFLEINEQGQFLWAERVNPDIPMLNSFSNFLIAKGKQCGRGKYLPVVSLCEFDELSIEQIIQKSVQQHKGTALLRASFC